MGIDALDLSFQIEKEFNIRLEKDSAVVMLQTAGDLHAFMLRRMNAEDCVKKGWADELMLQMLRQKYEAFRPGSPELTRASRLVDLCGDAGKSWRAFLKQSELSPPAFPSSSQPSELASAAILILVSSAVVEAGLAVVFSRYFWILIPPTIALIVLVVRLANRPSKDQTIGELLTPLVWSNHKLIRMPRTDLAQYPRADEVWGRLVVVISNVLAVPIAEIRPESRMIEDLGMT